MLPTDSKARKDVPLYSGLLKYFPDALCAVAELSRVGNEQHNPGQPMHWSREKSSDHGDCIVRHQADAGTFDTDRVRHSTKVAWRALAQLQLELEAASIQRCADQCTTTNWQLFERRRGQRRKTPFTPVVYSFMARRTYADQSGTAWKDRRRDRCAAAPLDDTPVNPCHDYGADA